MISKCIESNDIFMIQKNHSFHFNQTLSCLNILKTMKQLTLFAIVLLSFTNTHAQLPTVSLNSWQTGITKPVDLTNVGDERIFIVKKDGQIVMYDTAANFLGTFMDINSIVGSSGNEQGLLGLAFDPHYKDNGYFFVDYTNNSGNTVIERFQVNANDSMTASPASGVILLTITQPYSNHNGGCLRFGPDGYLYIGMGDGGSGGDPGNRAQNINEYLGKMLRLDVHQGATYGIPPTNPFAGATAGLDEIWTYGMRNPWRFNFDEYTNDLWIGDVGQDTWEEIDHVPFGQGTGDNFGWRCYEATHTYNMSGCSSVSTNYRWPNWEYVHSGTNGCSITGGLVYRCPNSIDMWGRYLYSDYCSGYLWSLLPASGTFYNNDTLGNFTDNTIAAFGQDKWNNVYVCGEGNATVYRLVTPSTCQPVAAIHNVINDTINICFGQSISAYEYPGFTYNWFEDGNALNLTTGIISPTTSGYYQVEVTHGACSDTCDSVYVNLHAYPIITITGLAANYISGAATDTLSATPAGGTFSGAGMTDSIFDPSIPSLGNDTIYYTYTNQWGCTATSWMVTTILPNGIFPVNQINGISVFPNPNNGSFDLNMKLKNQQDVEISVFNLLGQKIISQQNNFIAGQHQLQFETDLSRGVYYLQVKSGEEQHMIKLVISY